MVVVHVYENADSSDSGIYDEEEGDVGDYFGRGGGGGGGGGGGAVRGAGADINQQDSSSGAG
eukprot:2390-Eustigmatos_ZCMA.PRE.1